MAEYRLFYRCNHGKMTYFPCPLQGFTGEMSLVYKVLTKELVHVANRLLPSLCAVRMTSIICMNHSASTFAFIQYPVLCSVEIQCTLRNLSLNSCPLFRHSCECQKSLVFLRIVALVHDEVIIFALGKRSHSSIAIMNHNLAGNGPQKSIATFFQDTLHI